MKPFFSSRFFNVQNQKKLLFLVILLSLCYTAFTLTKKKEIGMGEIFSSSSDSSSGSAAQRSPHGQELTELIQTLKTKKVFLTTLIEKKAPSDKDQKRFEQLREDLSLVGIIAGNPQRAMIESKAKGQSYYLIEGESFMDDILVDKIEQSSITLNFRGRYFDLFL